MSKSSLKGFRVHDDGGGDIEMNSAGEAISNVISNNSKTPGINCPAAIFCVLRKSVEQKPADEPSTSASSRQKVKVGITEDFILTKNNLIYSSQEIFGWRASATVSQSEAATTSTTTTTDEFDDDCVVCLTEKKDTILLPCRHLCVCRGCLIHIDKCPVCRASFEEYLILSPNQSTPTSICLHLPSKSL